MTKTCDAPQARSAGADQQPMMLTATGVARMLNCSPRSVYRLADRGLIPRPVRLGGMVRWPAETVAQWIADGCPKPSKRWA